MNAFKVIVVKLFPLWLFLFGFCGGSQFSLSNAPCILVLGFAFFYWSLLISRRSLKFSVMYAFSFGYGFFSYSHSWISQPLMAFGNLYASIQPIVFVMVPAVLALYFVIIGICNYFLKLEGLARVSVFAILTVFMEYLRCEYAPSVPLGQVGSVWITNVYIAQGAAIFGIYGLSFVTVFLSYGIGALPRSTLVSVLIPLSLFAGIVMWGWLRVSTVNLIVDDHLIRIVPTSWNQLDKYRSVESRVDHLKELIATSAKGSKESLSLILWPETTIEFSLLQHTLGYDFMYPEIKSYLQQMLPKNGILLAGVIMRTPKNEAFNTVFGLTPTDDISYVYKKRFLAPFGEFMPPIVRSVTTWIGMHAMDDFSRGVKVQPQLVLPSRLKVNTLICYEGSFTQHVRQPYQETDLFTISTNDAWFRYNGKEQQFISHAFRAIEEGVPMVRAANMGFSGYISPIGTYQVSLTNAPLDFKIHKPLPETPYRWLTNRCTFCIDLFFGLWMVYIILSEILIRKRMRVI